MYQTMMLTAATAVVTPQPVVKVKWKMRLRSDVATPNAVVRRHGWCPACKQRKLDCECHGHAEPGSLFDAR